MRNVRLYPMPRHLFSRSLAAIALGAALLPAGAYAAAPVSDPAQPTMADPQQDDVLAGVDKFAKGAKEANEITLDKKMLGLAGSFLGSKDPNKKSLMGKMDSVVVRNYEYAAPDQYRMEDVEQVRRRLDSGGWSHLVKSQNAKQTTDICVKTDDAGIMSEMVIIDAEPTELNFIHLKGHMSVEDLSKMSGSFGGPTDPALKQGPK